MPLNKHSPCGKVKLIHYFSFDYFTNRMVACFFHETNLLLNLHNDFQHIRIFLLRFCPIHSINQYFWANQWNIAHYFHAKMNMIKVLNSIEYLMHTISSSRILSVFCEFFRTVLWHSQWKPSICNWKIVLTVDVFVCVKNAHTSSMLRVYLITDLHFSNLFI